MAAELFSTSLPHGSEVEVKKGFIQPNDLELPLRNHDDCNQDNAGGSQLNVGSSEREERDGWQEAQPTLRERSVLRADSRRS